MRLHKRLDAIGHIHARNDLTVNQRTRKMIDLKIKARKEAEKDRHQPELKYGTEYIESKHHNSKETLYEQTIFSDDESIAENENNNSKLQEMRIKKLVRRCTQLEQDVTYWKKKFGKESAHRIETARLRAQIQALKDKLASRKKISSTAIKDMHADRQRATLVRRARDLEAEKATLQMTITDMNREYRAKAKNHESLKQRLKTMEEKTAHYKEMYYKQLRAQANLITQSEWQELSDQGKADMLEATKHVGFAPKWKESKKGKGKGIRKRAAASGTPKTDKAKSGTGGSPKTDKTKSLTIDTRI